MRVLIVEDEPNLRQQLQNTLEGAGYVVDTAGDGEEGAGERAATGRKRQIAVPSPGWVSSAIVPPDWRAKP